MRTVSDVAATTGNLISHLVQNHGLEKRGRWSFPHACVISERIFEGDAGETWPR
jgi:hypothetical protein